MKTYKYKLLGLLLVLAVGVQAQKYDKKVKESFKVNSDVTLVVNSTHTDVDIQTWNKNTVSIEAVMEVEGVSKEEADEILAMWDLDIDRERDRVEISSFGDNFEFEFNHDFDFDFDFDFPEIDIDIPEIVMPDIDVDFPEIDFPEIDFPEIDIPEIDIEIEEFDHDAYEKDSTYLKRYKLRVQKQVEKFKNSDWKKKVDSFKNSKAYKEQMEEVKKQSKLIAKQLKESEWFKKMEDLKNSKEFKMQIEESKKVAEEIKKQMLENKEQWKEQAKMAKEAGEQARKIVEEMKASGKLDSLRNRGENVYFKFLGDKNKEVKIRKYIKIKVPKKAKFDLNVRHGKLNVPESNTKMSAVISYGNFIAGIIDGGKNELEITNSPVIINTINAGNVTLKNVPNATFGTFSESNLFANSSNVVIGEVGENVALSQRFGELEVNEIISDFKTLNLIVDYAKANLTLSSDDFVYRINNKNSKLKMTSALTEVANKTSGGVKYIEGFYNDKSSENNLLLTGVFSTVVLN